MLSKRLFIVLLFGVGIPIIGYLVSYWILNDASQSLAKSNLPEVDILCASERALTVAGIKFCEDFTGIFLLRDVSIWSGMLGIAIPVISWFGALICGTNRNLLSKLFPPIVKFSIFLLSISVLMQGAILTYSAYVGESYAIGRVHFFLIGAIGLGALFAAFKLIGAAFGFGSKLQTTVVGKALSKEDAPRFHDYVGNLASKLEARAPDNIVVGLEPNFFATSADVNLLGSSESLQGETLYVSAPLARLFTEAELSSVIGHELGHFRGADTVYSLRFAPVYSGLAASIEAVDAGGGKGASGLAEIPARATLSFIYELFARNESAISRERELSADRAGAEVSSPASLATALVKLALYGALWGKVQEDNVDRLNDGRVSGNLSKVYEDAAKFDIEHKAIEAVLNDVLEISIPHPTDTHPTIGTRLEALQVEPSAIDKNALLVPEPSAIDLIDNANDIEEELSVLEHQLMVAMGHVGVPEDGEQEEDHFLRIAYSLAASMVGADGKIQPEEIQVAEGIGAQLFEGFDPVDFREMCDRHTDLPASDKLAAVLKDVLSEDHKEALIAYLEEIAKADGVVDPKEEALLSRVRDGLGAGS